MALFAREGGGRSSGQTGAPAALAPLTSPTDAFDLIPIVAAGPGLDGSMRSAQQVAECFPK
eukprot:9926501-Alexandrium_andersonii.AAC.1